MHRLADNESLCRGLGFLGADSGTSDAPSGTCAATFEGAMSCLTVAGDVMMHFTIDASDREIEATVEMALRSIREGMERGEYLSRSDMPNQVAIRYIGPREEPDRIQEVPYLPDGESRSPQELAALSLVGVGAGVLLAAVLAREKVKRRFLRIKEIEDVEMDESTEL
mmetsp:Transcript_31425/g.71910  ORF Transcript_31425/g.71910 Transcript_31425/m.71910 type:complete len:167 (-) Transcript_31425:111-611(-)